MDREPYLTELRAMCDRAEGETVTRADRLWLDALRVMTKRLETIGT